MNEETTSPVLNSQDLYKSSIEQFSDISGQMKYLTSHIVEPLKQ